MLERTVEPDGEPVTLPRLKSHCRLDTSQTVEDEDLLEIIRTARETVEAYTGRALLTQTWRETLPGFPASSRAPIELTRAPLLAVASITYVDSAGDSQTWAASNYTVQAPAGPQAQAGKVYLAYNKTWPVPRAQIDAVTITYTAGYGADPDDVPAPLRQACLLLAGDLYENRASYVVGTSAAQIPGFLERQLGPYVLPSQMVAL